MKILQSAVVLLATLAIAGCGKNEDIITEGGALKPPQNVTAYSAGSQSVTLVWAAPPGAGDSLFAGYLVQWTGGGDTLGKYALTCTATGLPQGVMQFLLYSRLTDGTKSSTGAVIQWAPADRFSNLTIYEYRGVSSVGNTAVDLGLSGGPATTLDLDQNAVTADLYLFGGAGQLVDNLTLVAPDQFYAALKATRFSSVTDSSSTLDFPRPTFPAATSFTEEQVLVTVNTIYYLQLVGPGNVQYFARVLVASTAGQPVGRSVTLEVSVQKAQGVPYADACREGFPTLSNTAMIVPFAR